METTNALRPAILIVSDTAYQDPSTDKSTEILSGVLAAQPPNTWELPATRIVPDNISDIQQAVRDWTDGINWFNLILISGGTGFAVKDNTPEAVSSLIHRHAPGLVHGMLASSIKVTPYAMMARPVAGVRDKSLVITLPGSPKGAKENLEAVVRLLPHACFQSAGADSRALHAGGVEKLEADAGLSANSHHGVGHGHGHHCHHHDHLDTSTVGNPQSNDPSAGPTRRYRSSPYPMLPVEEALKLINQHTPDPQVIEVPVGVDLVGSVIAEDIFAKEAVPAFRASIYDGYAVIAPESPSSGVSTKGTFPVAYITHANPGGALSPLASGTIARITTGAPLPPNANAVVMVEDTIVASTTADGKEEATVEILTGDIKPGDNVREPGSDIALGAKIFQRGDVISSVGGEIGLLAATGTTSVKVFKKPSIGVLSTGDELVEHDSSQPLHGGQIRDSNRPSLLSCLTAWGFPVVDLGIVRDTPTGELESALRDALSSVGRARTGVDVVVTTGGVSMGELDLLKPTIERSLGGKIHFGRVSMKPGLPTTFATVPFKDQRRSSKLIFSLPGNPASAIVTLNLFVLPCLHKLMGMDQRRPGSGPLPNLGLPIVPVVLKHLFPLDPKRTEYHRVVVTASRTDGKLHASSTGGQRSSRVGSLATANALVVLKPGSGNAEAGQVVDALLLGNIIGAK